MVDEIVRDSEVGFFKGQDASKVPDYVQPSQYYAGVNVSCYNGVLSPRWGNVKRTLDFSTLPGGVIKDNLFNSYENIFRVGRFQAFIPYSVGNTYYIIVVISGRIFIINQITFEVLLIPISDGSNLNEASPRINWSPAGKYLVIFDYPSRPVIIQGFSARRSVAANYEVPISVIGAYNQNRLFIGNVGNEFTAGDPAGSLAAPDAPITFAEVLQPAAPYFGQIFQLSTNYNNDPITAMTFLQTDDTSTGIGSFLVSTQTAIYSYLAQLPRAQWEAGEFGSILVYNNGIAGARSLINLNSDLIYLSSDCQVRSISMSRDEQHKWSKVPMSREVSNWLKAWDPDLISFGALAYFKNKVFITANPFRAKALDTNNIPVFDVAHGGMVVLELDNISNMSGDSPPVWAGLWTGMRPMDMFINNDRMFVMSKDAAYRNELYEVNPDLTLDTADGKERYVTSKVYTRTYFQESRFNNKEVHSMDIIMDSIQGDLNLQVEYKPSHSTKFLLWKLFKHMAPWRTCVIPNACNVNGLAAHRFGGINIGSPEDTQLCDPVTQDMFTVFLKLQLKFTISAKYWELREYMLKAMLRPMTENDPVCDEYPKVELCAECNTDWTVEPFDTCQLTQT